MRNSLIYLFLIKVINRIKVEIVNSVDKLSLIF